MYQPIIIIGAPRSGTNMLRDILTKIPGVGTWPCDEINLAWRRGNAGHPTDELTPDQAAPAARRHMRGMFDRLARRRNLRHVVEKTCANSLRVGYVDRLIPDAKYVWLVRDGRDCAASAEKRWKAPFELAYTLKKLRYAPWQDVLGLGWGWLVNRLHRGWSKERHLKSWGPRFSGMPEMLREASLIEVCAAQWRRCVEAARRDFAAIDSGRQLLVHYERFVATPREELRRVLTFLDIGCDADVIARLTSDVKRGSVGTWRRDLSDEARAKIAPIVDELLVDFKYEAARTASGAPRREKAA